MPVPIGLIQSAIGGIQAGIGAITSGIATKKLEKLQSPTYTQNKGILDFYNQALNRYNVSPTDSAMYKRQNAGIERNIATGIAGLNDRRSGVAGLSSLIRGGNDARLNANVAAENQQNQKFGQLGSAAQLKAAEDDKAFQINEQNPFERKYNLLAQKAGGANQVANAGISNVFGGLQNLSNINMIDKLNNGSGGSSVGGGGTGSSGGYYMGLNNDWLFNNRKRR